MRRGKARGSSRWHSEQTARRPPPADLSQDPLQAPAAALPTLLSLPLARFSLPSLRRPLDGWRSSANDLPGAPQRRRALRVAALAGLTTLLRPWPPFLWLPGWVVGGLLLWMVGEWLGWLCWPRRWR